MNNPIINSTVDSVIRYLNENGIQVQRDSLLKYIIKNTCDNQPSTIVSETKHTFKVVSKPKPKFKVVSKPKFKLKHQLTFSEFIQICDNNNLKFFQFFDDYEWTGPAIKVPEDEYDTTIKLFNCDNTLVLPGYGFSIIRPAIKMSDEAIDYPKEFYNDCQLTETPLIPYTSDNESDSDSDNEDDNNDLDDEFVAEEWVYNNTKYLIDSKTNYLYSPDTYEFMGKKTGEFSIDFNATEL